MGIVVDERAIPVHDNVKAACELLGIDPLYVANEGKLLAFVAPDHAERMLATVRSAAYGSQAAIIGEVTDDDTGVVLETKMGGHRILGMLTGEQLPRIC